MRNITARLNYLLDQEDKKSLAKNVILSIVVSMNEALGVGLIVPFVAAATDYSIIDNNEYLNALYVLFWLDDKRIFIIFLGGILLVYYILRGGVNLYYAYRLANFSEKMYFKISKRLYGRYLSMKYDRFVEVGTPTLTKTLVTESHFVTHVISSALLIMSEVLLVLMIATMMLIANFQMTLVMSGIFFIVFIVFRYTLSVRIKELGVEREGSHKAFYKIINDTFRNYKYVKTNNSNEFLTDEFLSTSSKFVETNIKAAVISNIPRIILEIVGFGIIILVIGYVMLLNNSTLGEALPVISLYAMALYRLMPSMNRIITSYNQLLYYDKSLDVVSHEVNIKVEDSCSKELDFNSKITLENITFFRKHRKIFDDISLNIKKGNRVGIVGESGSGKSTLVDILMGLIEPEKGRMLVDENIVGREELTCIRGLIGYVPQKPFLFHGSVTDNVAYGKKIDSNKIDKALKIAQIHEHIVKNGGVDTYVGEDGVLLSGGQMQRIAIARAIYAEPKILILDESTSALDAITAMSIIKNVYNLDKNITVVIITHNQEILYQCDAVYEIKDCKINPIKIGNR